MSIIDGIEDDIVSDGVFDARVQATVSLSENSISECAIGILWRVRRTGTKDWSASINHKVASEVVRQSGIANLLPIQVNDASAHLLTQRLLSVLKDWAGKRMLGELAG